MIDEILPPEVASAETRVDVPLDTAFLEEAAAIVNAVEKRRREYVTVRHCARRAMSRLGLPPAPVLSGPRGEPRWPDGVVGSMTHCDGYRAAALARSADVLSIGIDAEPDLPLPDGILDAIATTEERTQLRRRAGGGGAHLDRLLFSAKESIFKAWYPLTGRPLGFEDAVVRLDPTGDTGFRARVLVPAPGVGGTPVTELQGRWMARDGLVLTAVTVTGAPLTLPAERSRFTPRG